MGAAALALGPQVTVIISLQRQVKKPPVYAGTSLSPLKQQREATLCVGQAEKKARSLPPSCQCKVGTAEAREVTRMSVDM